ncbi:MULTISPECIES: hypothetical protein [Actinokineospora]|uniref:Uncharacterized protein n=1 Tax=Actinokineospora fastidiosa TaxID=1816 RepID=A0A918GRN2_9PSEU|nr:MULTISPECIES: hypothetical protein [Actinokineospora]UVS81359.1 hypothetical protein Actkin_05116 [Actinokineospora sp. UTMC 2448]GGS53067.1 hypothetical protein GCM10010171_55410 [Actinokineospora fastidiosa]
MREVLGILVCVQAVGGGVSAVLDGSRSWFIQRHVVPEALQVPVSVAMLVVGLALLWSSRKRAS